MTNTTNAMIVSEPFLDDAAAEALLANTPPESRLFARMLDGADAATDASFIALKETATKLSAAAPYMQPPESLRERVLLATAPKQFNINDYRKTVQAETDDGIPWFWRWGLVAAVVALVASGYRNYALQSSVAIANNRGTLQSLQMQHQAQALAMLLDPHVVQFPVRGNVGPNVNPAAAPLIGKFLVDPGTHRCMLVMPHAVFSPTEQVHWTIISRGVRQQFTGPAVGAPDVFYLPGTLSKPLDQQSRVNLRIASGPQVASFHSP